MHAIRPSAAALVAAPLLAAICATAAHAQSLTAVPMLPDWSGASAASLSADGAAVVGVGTTSTGGHAYISDSDGVIDLGVLIPPDRFSIAIAVSANGGFIVGDSAYQFGPGAHAILWQHYGFLQDLGTIGGYNGTSTAYGVSADGSIVVGESATSLSNEAFRWTSTDGMFGLGALSAGSYSQAYAVSADGSVIVGGSGIGAAYHAFRWTQADGMQDLGLLQGATYSRAQAISADGAVIVGSSGGDTTGVAFRWTAAAGMLPLGPTASLPVSEALAANADGSVIVGDAWQNPADRHAFLWTSALGLVDLRDYLTGHGVDTTGWTLTYARGLSADGLTIAGDGLYNNQPRGWIATLPRCGSADFDCDGAVGTDQDILAFFNCLAGFCPPPPCTSTADFNHDGAVGTDQDIEAFFRVLAGGNC